MASIVQWNVDEWALVFTAIREKRISDTGNEGDISADGIRYTEVNAACKLVLPENRRRKLVAQVTMVNNRYRAHHAHWLKLVYGDAPPEAKPVEDNSDEADTFVVPVQADSLTRKRVRPWNEDEWQAICGVLMRRTPLTMKSSTLSGIDEEDIRSAARSLWPDVVMPGIAIKAARETLLKCVVRANAEPEIVKQAPTASPADLLMQGFADEVAKKLQPALQQQLLNNREDLSNLIRTIVREEIRFAGLQNTARVQMQNTAARKPKVAIVGGYDQLSVVRDRLEQKFPMLSFTLLGRDPRNVSDTLYNADHVLCNTHGISHSTQKAVEKAAPQGCYRQIAAGVKNLEAAVEQFVNKRAAQAAAEQPTEGV